MVKVIRLPSPGPDDPLFSGKAIISVPVSRPRAKEGKPRDLAQAMEDALEEFARRKRRGGANDPTKNRA